MSPPVSAKDKLLTVVYIALWFMANGTVLVVTWCSLWRGWGFFHWGGGGCGAQPRHGKMSSGGDGAGGWL